MIARWWNGSWWHASRLDIWVDRDGDVWLITARIGGYDGERIVHKRDSAEAAEQLVERLKTTGRGAGQQWRNIVDTYRPRESY